jgi:hypothetical protein
MFKRHLIVVSSFLIFTGCSDQNIEGVKYSEFIIDSTYTVEQALDNRVLCEETEWESKVDDRDRDIVEYRCKINGVEDYFSNNTNRLEKAISNKYDYSIEDKQKSVERQASLVQNAPDQIRVIINGIESDGEDFNPSDYEFLTYGLRNSSCESVEMYDFSRERNKIPDFPGRMRKCLEDRLEKARKHLDSQKSDLADLKDRKEKAKLISGIEEGYEVFKWVLDDQSVYYTYGGIELRHENGESYTFDYMEEGGRITYGFKSALKSSLSDKFKNYEDYSSRQDVPTLGSLIGKI